MPKQAATSDHVKPATIAEETFTRAELRAILELVEDQMKHLREDNDEATPHGIILHLAEIKIKGLLK